MSGDEAASAYFREVVEALRLSARGADATNWGDGRRRLRLLGLTSLSAPAMWVPGGAPFVHDLAACLHAHAGLRPGPGQPSELVRWTVQALYALVLLGADWRERAQAAARSLGRPGLAEPPMWTADGAFQSPYVAGRLDVGRTAHIALWGLALLRAGYRDDAERVLKPMRRIQRPTFASPGQWWVYEDDAFDVSLWSLLSSALGKPLGDRSVASEGPPGVMAPDWRHRRGRMVSTTLTCLWAMAQVAAGAPTHASYLADALAGGPAIRDDGLVADCFGVVDGVTLVSRGVSLATNAQWGLLLRCLGRHDAAEAVTDGLLQCLGPLSPRAPILATASSPVTDSADAVAEAYANCWWGLLLCPEGPELLVRGDPGAPGGTESAQ
jgi:hypothetical protein